MPIDPELGLPSKKMGAGTVATFIMQLHMLEAPVFITDGLNELVHTLCQLVPGTPFGHRCKM